MRMIAVALVASLMLAAVPAAHASSLEIDFVVVQYPSLEYDDFVGTFNSILIEELKKTDGKGFTPARWHLLISPIPPSNKKIKIEVGRNGTKNPVIVSVLNENASFVEIQQVVWLVVEVVQRGGVK